MVLVGLSKIHIYEKPYNVKGIIQLTGLKELPKFLCKDRIIGTWKARDMEVLPPMK